MTNLLKQIETWAGEPIAQKSGVGGGSIASTSRICFASGREVFLKTGANHPKMFSAEANGLAELRKTGTIRVPEVLHVTGEMLLLENISTGNPRGDFFERFGRQFAELHRHHAETFGFYEDNFIGATPQINLAAGKSAQNWAEFFWEKRLLFQYKLAEKRGYATPDLTKLFGKLESAIADLLAGSEEPPSLLHGDLWSGNFLADENNEPVLIDPAVYYGHREADLAMTQLFGGFSESFYAAYRESFPLPDGWQERENLYKLYHVLNHLNLFGRGYYSQAISLLRNYF